MGSHKYESTGEFSGQAVGTRLATVRLVRGKPTEASIYALNYGSIFHFMLSDLFFLYTHSQILPNLANL